MPKIDRAAASPLEGANDNEQKSELEEGIAQALRENLASIQQADAAEKANKDLMNAKVLLEKEDAYWKSKEAGAAPAAAASAPPAAPASGWSEELAALSKKVKEEGPEHLAANARYAARYDAEDARLADKALPKALNARPKKTFWQRLFGG
jgi:hypothetical protein